MPSSPFLERLKAMKKKKQEEETKKNERIARDSRIKTEDTEGEEEDGESLTGRRKIKTGKKST